jgi:hypothetical protein
LRASNGESIYTMLNFSQVSLNIARFPLNTSTYNLRFVSATIKSRGRTARHKSLNGRDQQTINIEKDTKKPIIISKQAVAPEKLCFCEAGWILEKSAYSTGL